MMKELAAAFLWLFRVVFFGALITGVVVGIWRRDVELAIAIILGTIVAAAFVAGGARTLHDEWRRNMPGKDAERDVYGRARFGTERSDAERSGLK